MNQMRKTAAGAVAAWVLALCLSGVVLGNEGPFVIKYPEGDPAAQGVLARLDADLRPARETRLRVLQETIEVGFHRRMFGIVNTPAASDRDPTCPSVEFNVAYRIENPTDEPIELDLGFPVVRGIADNLFNVQVWHEDPRKGPESRVSPKWVDISYSVIYGIIRERARERIEACIATDETLRARVGAVRNGTGEASRQALGEHLTGPLKWSRQDAALLVEYASLRLDEAREPPGDAAPPSFWRAAPTDRERLKRLTLDNLGPLSAIGEQKATQLLAQLAARFDPKAGASYEAIFSDWGGSARESSVDLATGKVRPREVELDRSKLPDWLTRRRGNPDPTVYARVDYLDDAARITEAEKASCRAILKNLPVVFSFAPMSLIHYRVRFEAKATQIVKVWYFQHAYLDTRAPRSYQIGYVLHPSTFWEHFGPIHVKLIVPEGVPCRASVATEGEPGSQPWSKGSKRRVAVHQVVLDGQKPRELLFAVDGQAWERAHGVSPWAREGLDKALPKP